MEDWATVSSCSSSYIYTQPVDFANYAILPGGECQWRIAAERNVHHNCIAPNKLSDT